MLRYGAKRVADPMMGSGTTRDVVNWLNEKVNAEIKYWGARPEGLASTCTCRDLPE